MTVSRLGLDEYFLAMAALVARRSTCVRRTVGCVLVDADHHVLATGYNGVASGEAHCIDYPCAGADLPSGTGLEKCEAIHAEQNAILQCNDVRQIKTAYVTVSPCVTCTKLLMNTGCTRIVFSNEYTDTSAARLWKGEWINGGSVEHVLAKEQLETTDRSTGSVVSKGNQSRRGDTRPEPDDTRTGRRTS